MLMWGYTVLPSGQWFAAFLAVMMSIMLIFWVNEAKDEAQVSFSGPRSSDPSDASAMDDALAEAPTIEASILRLDSLKSELKTQYAQFGRDQSLLNSKSLGSWHGPRNPRTR